MNGTGIATVPSAQALSPYRAIHHLRKGGLHSALGIKDHENLTNEHLDRADKATNDHVKEMAKYARLHKNAK